MAKLPNRLVIEIANTDKVDELGYPVVDFETKDYAECIIEELETIREEIMKYSAENKNSEDLYLAGCGVGQPVYDKDKNIMGWLGIGLFENLNYSAKIRVPCEYWQICLPTKFCEVGKQVYTYWQMTGIYPQESEDKE